MGYQKMQSSLFYRCVLRSCDESSSAVGTGKSFSTLAAIMDHRQGRGSGRQSRGGASSASGSSASPNEGSSSAQREYERSNQASGDASDRPYNRIGIDDLLNSPDVHPQERQLASGDSGVPIIVCGIGNCGRRYTSEESLRIHQSRHHAAPTSLVCRQCQTTYSSVANLNKHIRTIHERRKPHQCPICSAAFAFKDGLQRHIDMVHHDVRPFSCSFCRLRFKTRSHLNKHLLSKHPQHQVGSTSSSQPHPSSS